MIYNQLHDKVHAIMVEEFLKDLKEWGGILNIEEPFNQYGIRGFPDIVHYHTINIDVREELLAVYELKPYIYNLNEDLRQVTTYSNYVIEHFKKKYPSRPIDVYWTHLVLLNTKQNCDTILAFQNSFAAVFKNAPGWIHDKYQRFLMLYDPLENVLDPMPTSVEEFMQRDPCERLRTIHFFEDDIKRLHSDFHYQNASEFYEKYIKSKA